jgi:hypothetical protein
VTLGVSVACRTLTEKACDYLVEMESEHMMMLKRFHSVSFQEKEVLGKVTLCGTTRDSR